MAWIKKSSILLLLTGILLLLNSCKISLGLAPITSIDYSKVKTISIADFQNRAEYVYAPLATEFNQRLKDSMERLPDTISIMKLLMLVVILLK